MLSLMLRKDSSNRRSFLLKYVLSVCRKQFLLEGFCIFLLQFAFETHLFHFFCVFEYKGKTWCLGYWSQNVPNTCAKMQVAFRMLISMWKCLRKAIGARVQLALMILMLKCLRKATYWRKRSTCFYDIALKMFRKSNWRKN